MNIFKLERILNHQQHLHFNCKWPEDEYYDDGYNAAKREFMSTQDIPTQVELGEKFPFTGYVTIDGECIKCKSCEHEKIVRDIIYDNPTYFKKYRNCEAKLFEKKPQGMLQEEYFLMKYLGFVKISSFEKAPTKRILFRYENLTWKQSDVIYPL
jgi:hypothetical protein